MFPFKRFCVDHGIQAELVLPRDIIITNLEIYLKIQNQFFLIFERMKLTCLSTGNAVKSISHHSCQLTSFDITKVMLDRLPMPTTDSDGTAHTAEIVPFSLVCTWLFSWCWTYQLFQNQKYLCLYLPCWKQ